MFDSPVFPCWVPCWVCPMPDFKMYLFIFVLNNTNMSQLSLSLLNETTVSFK
uniref:Uncharacterized protein n=1 Tax=Anguilla anguilla TaxID=7936 RepID=A0A0E9TRT0_ANGAN